MVLWGMIILLGLFLLIYSMKTPSNERILDISQEVKMNQEAQAMRLTDDPRPPNPTTQPKKEQHYRRYGKDVSYGDGT